jgi:hypothetical protein
VPGLVDSVTAELQADRGLAALFPIARPVEPVTVRQIVTYYMAPRIALNAAQQQGVWLKKLWNTQLQMNEIDWILFLSLSQRHAAFDIFFKGLPSTACQQVLQRIVDAGKMDALNRHMFSVYTNSLRTRGKALATAGYEGGRDLLTKLAGISAGCFDDVILGLGEYQALIEANMPQ